MKKLAILLSMILCSVALVACSSTTTEEVVEGTNSNEPKKGGTYILSIAGDPQGFNPNAVSDDNAYPINQNIFNRLVKTNDRGEILPDLAKDWTYSDDKLEITFNLYENVKWHDGTEFTSEDVKWTFDEIKDKQGLASANLSNVVEITCPDKNTVVFKLQNPDASTLGYLSWYGTFIMPKHIYEGTDWTTNPANQSPIGTGPFKFVEFKKGVSVTVERNDDFFKETAHLDKVVFSIIPDQDTAFQSFLNGEIDETGSGIPYADAHRFDNDTNYSVVEQVWMNRTYVTYNMKSGEIFSDAKIREAVTLGINRDEVFDKALKGIGMKGEYYISPAFTWALNDSAKVPARNVEKARQLIEEAGYTADENGMYFSVTMDTFAGFDDVVAVVKENLKEIGIDVTINQLEMGAYQEKVMVNKDFDITILAGYQGPDISGVANRLTEDGILNLASYKNEEVEALLKEGNSTYEQAERAEKYKEIQTIVAKDMPIVPLAENGGKKPIPTYVKGHPALESFDKASTHEYTYVWLDK